MEKDSTNPGSLHALRQEFRAARHRQIAAMQAQRPTVYVEDIIIDRLYEAEANLSLAIGLFKELADDEQSPYLSYKSKLCEALEIVRDALHLRKLEGGV